MSPLKKWLLEAFGLFLLERTMSKIAPAVLTYIYTLILLIITREILLVLLKRYPTILIRFKQKVGVILYYVFLSVFWVTLAICSWLGMEKIFNDIEGKLPHISTKPADSKATPKIKSLHDFFLNDFNYIGGAMLGANYHIEISKDEIYKLQYIIVCDPFTKSMFFSVYLPESQHTFTVIRLLATEYNKILEMNIQPPDETNKTFGKLVFTRRVYIYHETYLLPKRIEVILEEYRKEGLAVEFRGREYEIIKNSPLYPNN